MAALTSGQTQGGSGGEPPNILWITCEDISPHLGCYGCANAVTPNLDALAEQGSRYTHAFSVSGVCAPSRSCLITGMYPSSLGTQHMRCNNPPPEHVKCFPEYLRERGYFCTNNAKTDYQFPVPDSAWDECSRKAHWRHRNPEQPFFAVFNFTVSHESQVARTGEEMAEQMQILPPGQRCGPASVELPPYYPDTPVVRRHWAHYLDLVAVIDRQAGRVLDELEEDGLAANTAVFFFSDHGVGLPRAKRWLYDSGIHVPFIVRWPGVTGPGAVTDRLVSFVDFAPTVLSMADVPVPGHMQGRPFLGATEGQPRDYVYAARDRMDERYDIIRAVRGKRFKYLRNYEPYRPYDQHLAYPEKFPVLRDMRRVLAAGELSGPELQFFGQKKPVEELYDTEADPHEITNLAGSTEYAEVLARMRERHLDWMFAHNDLAFVPEPELERWLANRRGDSGSALPETPYEPIPGPAGQEDYLGRPVNARVEALNSNGIFRRLLAIKELGELTPASVPVLVDALDDPEVSVAYWAAVGLGHSGSGDDDAAAALSAQLEHSSATVRIAAAEALCRLGHEDKGRPVVVALARDGNPWIQLKAVHIIDECGLTGPEVTQTLTGLLKAKPDYYLRASIEHAQKE